MTEQTIKSVKNETRREVTDKWRKELIALHNDFVFDMRSDEKHYACEKLRQLAQKMLEYMKENKDGSNN